MKRLSYLLVFFVICLGAKAQRITVESFKPLPFDMTASSLEGKKIDQNGEIAALIKIVTSETGFAFDAGTLGVVDSKQKIGEVWVWVPRGSRKISIFHQQLGILRDYRYPVEIEAERTYEMVLVTGKVETVVKQEVRQQYLAFQITPPNATLEVNERIWEVDGEGSAMKYVEFGTYTYRVQASGYYSDAGQVTVNDPENTQIVTVTLNPNFGWIEITGDGELNGASVYIDSDYIGKAPCKSKALKSGQHTLRVVKEMFENYTETVTVNDNETTRITPALKSDFALVTMTVDANAEIWVNNMRKGVRSWSGRLARGTYKIECRQAGYEDTQTILEVTEDMTEKTVTLQPPRPIYGSLNVETTPNFCNLYVDGENKGTTPKSISEILVGKHQIRLTKDGYAEYREDITITKGERYQIRANLNKLSTQAETDKPVSGVNSHSDFLGEGMWLPNIVTRLKGVDLEKEGLHLTSEELFSINKPCLKDAVVGLGNDAKPRGFYCTGEIVSEKGLLFTAHHCGYSAVQKLSSGNNNYLADGFWARNQAEELPVAGMSASFLIRIEDVSAKVLSAVSDKMDWSAKTKAIKTKIKELENAASENGRYNPVIKGFFEGNEYYMFVYQVFTDVRLVGVPEASIGKFGGETDNWMWPRYTADFCIFRVYADRNGNPANYSSNNIPLNSKWFLPISLGGVKQNDFTMIWQFPGNTERYMSSYGIDYNVNVFYPIIIDIFGKELKVMDEFMQKDNAIKLMYADNHASLSNTWKNFVGQCTMIPKNKVVENKQSLENDFTKWVNANSSRKAKYSMALPNLKRLYEDYGRLAKNIYYPNFVSRIGAASIASSFRSYYQAATSNDKNAAEAAKMELKRIDVSALFSNKDPRVEKKLLAELLKTYRNAFKNEKLPEFYSDIDKKFKGSVDAFVDDIYKNSIFATAERVKNFIDSPSAKKMSKDYAFLVYLQMTDVTMEHIPAYQSTTADIAENKYLFLKGLLEYYASTQPNKNLYPDANSSMRVSLGCVRDYSTDEKYFDYVCTAQGMLEKYNPGDHEFDLPKKFVDLVRAKNYGRYADGNGNLNVSFITTNDLIGGSSGSPVINGKGELIGLAYDSNWEGMSGDVFFEKKRQRTVALDIRYLLFIIDKYAGATNILNELNIH